MSLQPPTSSPVTAPVLPSRHSGDGPSDARPLGSKPRRVISDRVWWFAVALLLAWGVRLALVSRSPDPHYTAAARAVLLLPLIALWPAAARRVASAVRRVRRLPRSARPIVALALGAVGMTYLYLSALQQGQRLVPMVKDEYSYLLQARMLSTGRLWLPRHALADFFDATALLSDRVYASVYTPGVALLLAPGAAFDWPHWIIPMLLSGAAVAMLYLTVAALADDWYGIAAALFLVGCGVFHTMWRTAMAQVPAMLFGMLLVGCFLRWRARRHSLAWAAAMGAVAGWEVIIRPQDAVCYVLPVAVAMLLALRRRPWKVAASIAACVVAAAPFFALQLVTNVGVTGRWSDFPHNYYHRRDLPHLGYGFYENRLQREFRPASVSPQKQTEFDLERSGLQRLDIRNRGDWMHVWNHRIPTFVRGTLPAPFLVVFLPVGLVALGRRWRWVPAAVVPLFLLVYLPWPFILPHYPLAAAPAALLLVVLGMRAIERRARRIAPAATAAFALLVVAAFVTALPQVNATRAALENPFVAPQDLDRMIRQVTPGRAVVLLRYDFWNGGRMRPYNIDVANPDDAPIIKALDLGPRNGEIYAYYAERQPDREFFRYDFADASLTRLGSAAELGERPVPPP